MAGISSVERDWLLEASGSDVREFYATLGVELPDHAGEQVMVRCFANPAAHAHDDRKKSCSVNVLTGLWCCHACGRSGNPYAAALACGFDERRSAAVCRQFGLFLELAKEKPKLPGWRQYAAWKKALWAQPKLIERLRVLKGWTPYAIQRCGLGWDGERITFVIRRWIGETYRIVGVARYLPGGDPKMLALPGSRRELFPAPELMVRDRPVFVVEGEPDAVSVRSTGHQAVAVPGAASWRAEWADRLVAHRSVVVLCDCDSQGRQLAERVGVSLPAARVVDLAPDRDDGYDIGDEVLEASRAPNGLQCLGRLLSRFAEREPA